MKYGLFLALMLFAAGCDRAEKDLATVQDDLGKLVEQAGKHVDAVASNPSQVTDAASAEVEKIFTYEYKVFPIPGDRSAKIAESALNQLGKDRWDCFQITEMEEGLSAFCRRAPKSFLRYIPRFVP